MTSTQPLPGRQATFTLPKLDLKYQPWRAPRAPYLDGLSVWDPAVDRDLGSCLAPVAAAGGGGGRTGATGRRRGLQLLVLHGNHPGDQTGRERWVKAGLVGRARRAGGLNL